MNGHTYTDKTKDVQNYVTCCELAESAEGHNEYWSNRRDVARLDMDVAAGVDVDRFLAIMASISEPQKAGQAGDVAFGQDPLVDWPWTDEDWQSELDNRRPEVGL